MSYTRERRRLLVDGMERVRIMDLGYGFISGINRIIKQKVFYWLHTNEDITWDSFVWHIADYCDIEDFGEDWISVRLVSVKQREFFL